MTNKYHLNSKLFEMDCSSFELEAIPFLDLPAEALFCIIEYDSMLFLPFFNLNRHLREKLETFLQTQLREHLGKRFHH